MAKTKTKLASFIKKRFPEGQGQALHRVPSVPRVVKRDIVRKVGKFFFFFTKDR